ncbi:hypothetical protein QAD02_017809 [Eretmocerus hayati]|uniref:Uncharacterized protein n=1 Tax=Eretmocerus hayati TaxID=131215 RepID=A0ACC2PHX0_9HYME|nr:hypothetical protein QAD02_017809 [Eretmocerus hayati]
MCVCEYSLLKFINELNYLLCNGIEIDDDTWSVEVHEFICETPACAVMKCIKGHTGHSSCEHCTVEGCKFEGTTVYLAGEDEMRTDRFSPMKLDPAHHHDEVSPSTGISHYIAMINQFVIQFMHQGSLGVTKKLLQDYWLKTSTKTLTRNDYIRVFTRLSN